MMILMVPVLVTHHLVFCCCGFLVHVCVCVCVCVCMHVCVCVSVCLKTE